MGLIDTVAVRKGDPIIGDDFETTLKADYENRLKADMVAMLEELRLDFQEAELAGVLDNKELIFADEVDDLVQQKINALKGDSDGA